MKILFADALEARRIAALRDAGHDCEVVADLGAGDLPDRLGGVDVLVVRSTKVTAEAIAAADRLGLIVRAGAGVDNIDLDAASARAVYVCNVPGRNAVAVAELTMALLLAIDRHVPDGVADLRDGRWDKKRYTEADGIYGKRLAVIGMGDIGLAVAERARAFGMVVATVAKDRSPERQAEIDRVGIEMAETLDELLAAADVVSIHVPRAPDTVGLIDAEFLAKLPDGAIVLNTSRGDCVDPAALLDALDNRDMRAGLDVWPDEPAGGTGPFTSELAGHPRVVGSHHIGASTRQAQDAIAAGTIEVIERYADGEVVNCVNLIEETLGTARLSVRHLDQVGVLAQVLGVLRANGLNVQQMQNQIFHGSLAAVAIINVDGGVVSEVLDQLGAIDEVLAVSLLGV